MLAGTYRFVFTLPYLCFFWMWKLYRNNFYLGNLNLPCFSKKAKKTWEIKGEKFTPHNRTNRTSKRKSSRLTRHRAGKLIALFKHTRTLKFKGNKYPQNGSKFTNHKPWPFEPVEVNFCFRRGLLESAEPSDFDWRRRNPKSKDVFDIAGRVISETALMGSFLLAVQEYAC